MMTHRRIDLVWVLALVICGFCGRGIAADAASPTFVYVCRNVEGRSYLAFPDVCRLRDGRLVCVFYAGYDHGSPPTPQWPKGGGIFCCTSRDEGHSWSKVEVLYDGPDDELDTSIVQLKDGRIICNFFACWYPKPAPNPPWVFKGTRIITSDDLGKTWSQPREIYADYSTSSPIRELSDGRLIMGLYRRADKTAYGAVGISDDGGKTWGKPIDIDNGGVRLDAETDVIELRDGSLYAIQRAEMCYSISKDRGKTWSISKPAGFGGHSPYLHRTPDGMIILGYRRPSDGTTMDGCTTNLRYSRDECKTWSDAVMVDKVIGAYPSMVNLKDGSVLIVYYDEAAGAKSSIRAKRFRATPKGIEWLEP